MTTAIHCPPASQLTTTGFLQILVDVGRNTLAEVRTLVVSGSAARALPIEFGDIDALMGAWDSDSEMANHMSEARTWAGHHLFGDGSPTLKMLRLQRGMSQTAFAAALGSSQGYVSRLESGQVDARASMLTRISEVLKMEVSVVASAVCAGARETGQRE